MFDRRLVAVFAVVALAVTACGDDATEAGPTVTETVTETETATPAGTTEPTEPSPTASSPAEPSPDLTARPFVANTEPDDAEGEGDHVTVTDVAVTGQRGFDRVVLPVSEGGLPGWSARYVEGAVAQGSGRSVDVAGSAVIEVNVANTGYPADTGAEFEGEERVDGVSVVREVVHEGVFEGITQIFVGTDGEQPFRVRWDDSSRAVIVEVMTPEAAAL